MSTVVCSHEERGPRAITWQHFRALADRPCAPARLSWRQRPDTRCGALRNAVTTPSRKHHEQEGVRGPGEGGGRKGKGGGGDVGWQRAPGREGQGRKVGG